MDAKTLHKYCSNDEHFDYDKKETNAEASRLQSKTVQRRIWIWIRAQA